MKIRRDYLVLAGIFIAFILFNVGIVYLLNSGLLPTPTGDHNEFICVP